MAILDEQEANFMMEHIGEIAGALGGASLSMGVGKDMLADSLGKVQDTLRGIESLHKSEFAAHGKLNSPQFYNSRRMLYQQLETQLRSAFLDKYLNLGNHESLRKGLGISTKSLVHHWSKSGAPGVIPGYATHLDEVARTAKYLKYGGGIAIGIGAGAAYMNVYDACRAGETEECKRVRLTQTGALAGGVVGGAMGAWAGTVGSKLVCRFGVWGKALCGIVIVGSGSYQGASRLGEFGEEQGEVIFERLYD